MRKILAITSDLHGGCNLGLMNPATQLIHFAQDGEQTTWIPSMTASQEHLWGLYLWAIGEIEKLADGDEIVMLDNGDSTHGLKFHQELVSTRLDDQLIIAAMNLGPWLSVKNVRVMRLVYGTGSHVFGEGSAPRMIADRIRAEWPQLDVRAVEHGSAKINGVKVDYAHRGPGTGIRHWLHGNVARFYLRDIVQGAILSGEEPPAIVVRGHFHAPVYEYLEQGEHQAHLVVCPSMCMLGEYGRQATKSTGHVTNGLCAFELEGGKVTGFHRFYRTIDITTKEEL